MRRRALHVRQRRVPRLRAARAHALVAPRRDVEALASALGRLVEDPGLRERIAGEGRRFVTTQFDWERAAVQLEAVLATPASRP